MVQGPRASGGTGGSAPSNAPTFASLGVVSEVHSCLARSSILKPTTVQSAVIPRILDGKKDVLVLSETGSGKTHAYVLPLVSKLVLSRRAQDAAVTLGGLIIVPTRELAHQVTRMVTEVVVRRSGLASKKDVTKPRKSLVVRKFVGEVTPMMLQSIKVDPPHIAVGTPRTLHKLIPSALSVGSLQTCVVDEVDHVASPWSKEFLEGILDAATGVAHRPQVVYVGATTTGGVHDIVTKYSKQLTTLDLTMSGERALPRSLSHIRLVCLSEEQRLPNITRVLAALKPMRALVFANSTQQLQACVEFLKGKGVRVEDLVSTKTNREREQAIEKFSSGRAQVLVCLEGSSRGLDFKSVDVVISASPPESYREYVHRAGRTARMGRKGVVVTLTNRFHDAEVMEGFVKRLRLGGSLLTVTPEELLHVAPRFARASKDTEHAPAAAEAK